MGNAAWDLLRRLVKAQPAYMGDPSITIARNEIGDGIMVNGEVVIDPVRDRDRSPEYFAALRELVAEGMVTFGKKGYTPTQKGLAAGKN